MQWLEPLVDIDGVAYGPVSVDQIVPTLSMVKRRVNWVVLRIILSSHNQTRLTFARAGKTRPTFAR
jgi:formate dehydrogenase iron-sulfur subunit